MSNKSKIDQIRNRAIEITKREGRSTVGVANLLTAILEDEHVETLLLDKGINVTEIRKILGRQIQQSARQRQNNKTTPTLSEQVEEALDNSLSHIKQHKDYLKGKDAFIILATLLKTDHRPTPVKILENNGISFTLITDYLNEHDINLEEAPLFIEHDTSLKEAYTPQINKSDSPFLCNYTTCLNDSAHEGKLAPTIGRTDEIQAVLRTLRQKGKNSALLLGEAGVGKTAIVEGLAQMANDGSLPPDLKNKQFFQLDLNALIAGAKWRGDFEKRIEGVLEDLASRADRAGRKDDILFIDEMHALRQHGDLVNALKPALARGDVTCIGATTFDEYRGSLAKDKALARRFAIIKVNEPPLEDVHDILMGIRAGYEDHHNCIITSDAISSIIELSDRYITDRNFPDKAIELMDATGAIMRETHDHIFGEKPDIPVMTTSMVAKALAKKTGLPLDQITASDRDKILSLSDTLNSVVFGQEAAAEALTSSYRISRAGLSDPNKPIGSFLLKGPTGVGKTEITKQLAESLGMPLIRFDMSEYTERHTVSRLIGAPPGYVGFNDGGLLTEAIHRNPHSVLLLDEIEKAHPDLFNVLLQVMDNGELTDSSGKTVNFRNVILCMTTNVGEGGKSINAIGFGRSEVTTTTKDGDLENMFRPEFRNRLDAIIPFNPLTKEVMPQILGKVINDLQEQLNKRAITINLTHQAKQFLVTEGFDAKMGARPLKRIFQQHVTDPVSTILLTEDLEGEGGTLAVSKKGKGLSINFSSTASNDNRKKGRSQRRPEASFTPQ